MIVYNVDRSWFTMKAGGEAYRKAQGLPPSATTTIRVDDREDLAALLNGLCGIAYEAAAAETPVTAEELAVGVVVRRVQVSDVPDCVPQFLRVSWAKMMKAETGE